MTGPTLPLPPLALRERVGATTLPGVPEADAALRTAEWWDPDPAQAWLRQGRALADLVRARLPGDLDLRGARVLDFGCGAGRVLRHLAEDLGDDCELHGADIDEPSIEWLETHASPPLHPVLCSEHPGLPHPDGTFDLVYALSVFTHIAEHWAGWLAELHRVLAPGGLLLATVIAPQTADELGLCHPGSEPPGAYFQALGNPWERGGPVVVHHAGWVTERWGRAFAIVDHAPRATPPPWPHDVVVARRLDVPVTEEELLAPCADGEAEAAAAAAQLRSWRDEALRRHGEHERWWDGGRRAIRARREGLEGDVAAAISALQERRANAAREAQALTRARAHAGPGGDEG